MSGTEEQPVPATLEDAADAKRRADEEAAANAAEGMLTPGSRGGRSCFPPMAIGNHGFFNFGDNNTGAGIIGTEVSQNFSKQASGRVYVVLGKERRPDNIWETEEFPTLKKNPKVTEIIAIDPETGEEAPYWKPGDP